MRKRRGGVRVSFAIVLIGSAATMWSCSWGVHLWPDRYDWVTGERTAPAALKAAKTALAEAKAAGAENVKAARYPFARAKEYLIIAEHELAGRDYAAAETTAGIAKKAAEEAKAIAQRGG
ncbi:MAG TPA: hypothetical protein VFF86_04330 [Candidatus Methylomirabilis sp.]|nr:hypothetical protein [Candidatus Methylomirabilis sp.]